RELASRGVPSGQVRGRRFLIGLAVALSAHRWRSRGQFMSACGFAGGKVSSGQVSGCWFLIGLAVALSAHR
ncbi:hypothetical protein, partial [Actinomadura luteofluorescens]